jgi:PEP-CTERM motif
MKIITTCSASILGIIKAMHRSNKRTNGQWTLLYCRSCGIRAFPGLVLLLLAIAPNSSLAAESVSDLWDLSRGSVVTADSGVFSDFPVGNMFGGTGGSGNWDYTIFDDSHLAGFVHYVEWRTPAPVRLSSFNLYANHDGPPFDANERGFSRFTLMARNPATLQFEPLYTYVPTNPYQFIGPDFLLVSAVVPPIVAQEFRAEFVQYGDRTPTARGPRIDELDGFGTVVPEPSAFALGGLGFIALFMVSLRRHVAR